jgi:hypothetical protein
MQNQIHVPVTNQSQSNISLYQLVNKVIQGIMPLAVNRRSFIINDVDRNTIVSTDEQLLSFVVSTLLEDAIMTTENECIRVEAALSGDCALIKVRDNNSYYYNTVLHDLKEIQKAAEMIGGCVSIQHQPKSGTQTVFTFTNILHAA